MSVTLPDSSVFDADSDKISTSRPELKKMADAINTIGAEYNAGTLGGSGIQEIVAGTGISISTPDSAGSITVTNTAPFTGGGTITWTASDIQSITYTTGGTKNITLSSGKSVLIVGINTTGSTSITVNMDIQNMAVNSTLLIMFQPISLGSGLNNYQIKAGGTSLVGPNTITLNGPTLFMHKVDSLGTGNYWYHGHSGFTSYEASV